MLFKNWLTIPLILLLQAPILAQTTPSLTETDTVSVRRTNFAFIKIAGLSYQRERPLSRRNLLLISPRVYYDFLVGRGIFGDRFGHSLSVGLTVGSRHYYRLLPSPAGANTGNYLGLDFGAKTASVLSRNLTLGPVIYLSPYWGLRRRVGQRTIFDLNLGANLKKGVGNLSSPLAVSPTIQLSFGWALP